MSDDVRLFAFIGEDEFGSGEIGLKQGQVPAGMIPLVSVSRDKVGQDYIVEQMQRQADIYGKTIRLVEFEPVQEHLVLKPRTQRAQQ